jgi:putative transposase
VAARSRSCTCGAVDGRLPAGAEGAARRRRRGAVGGEHQPSAGGVGGGVQGVPAARPERVDYVYVWADGVHVNVRLGEQDRICLLVLIGARPDGTKELIAVEDGYRESAESWAAVLRDLKRQGMRAPALAIGDGALGFWAAVRDVWPETREQRDWVHRIMNVLDKLPKRLQARAKEALKRSAKPRPERPPRKRSTGSRRSTGRSTRRRWPRFAATRTSCSRSTTSRRSTGSTSGPRTPSSRASRPCGSGSGSPRGRARGSGLMMAYKLLRMAQERWRTLDGAELLPLVRAGVPFTDGEQVEREDHHHVERVAA